MRTQTDTYNVYTFDELSKEVQARLIEKNFDISIYEGWEDSVFDDAKEVGSLMGIDINEIMYSGFSSQGDGACFIGSYEGKKGAVGEIVKYAPQDKDLKEIAEGLFNVQRLNNYKAYAEITSKGSRYSHENTVSIEVMMEGRDDLMVLDEDLVIVYLKDFMKWIYKQLNNQYDFLTSEEEIRFQLQDNEYRKDGRIV